MNSEASAEGLPLADHYARVRAASEALIAPLEAEDCALQSMPDASPAKWHLAHTSWYFETFALERGVPGYRPLDPRYRKLFNSYYQGVGPQYTRAQRGMLTRPTLPEVFAYRRHVDRHLRELLDKEADLEPELRAILELGLHHEQQHQELMLTDIKHLFSLNPCAPIYRERAESPGQEVEALAWHAIAEGECEIGWAGPGFAFDNEGPRHRVFIESFLLASRPVSNGEYRLFVEAGGYTEPAHWMADGFAAVQEQGWRAPLYWEGDTGDWRTRSLAGLQSLADDEPVCHLSWYEADAYARWAGARLPREAEWEHVANTQPMTGNFVESGRFHPAPIVRGEGALTALFGDVWEWTGSSYAPYPRYQPPAGAVGEYNGKFMSNQFTLRGGSCATPRSHIRASYRNFFYPDARWQFSGVRLARDPD
ncbi:MAG: ergothioneine biosynthesis protein EgtB [Myxococcota bacterium]